MLHTCMKSHRNHNTKSLSFQTSAGSNVAPTGLIIIPLWPSYAIAARSLQNCVQGSAGGTLIALSLQNLEAFHPQIERKGPAELLSTYHGKRQNRPDH